MVKKRLDGYIRVSRVGGREGDSYISKDVQRERIERWAGENDVEIAAWWEEEDQSGGRLDRPQLQLALERCRNGDTNGIVVADRSRFARSLLGALQVIEDLKEVGATFAAADGLDSSTPEGELAINIMLSFADYELKRIRNNWRTAIIRAVARGVHVTGFLPAGYVKGDDGRLVVEPLAADAIREAFAMRARRVSFAAIADFLAERDVRPSATGNPRWSPQGVREMLRNRVYIGEARGPHGALNANAHEPVVTVKEFDAAQAVTTVTHPKDGSIAAQALLVGLIKCAGCGHNLTITGTGPRGNRQAVYYCRKNYATGLCPSPAVARAPGVDAFVVGELLKGEETRRDAHEDLIAAYHEAQEEVEGHELELDAYLQSGVANVVGQERFLRAAEELQRKLDTARGALAAMPDFSFDPLIIEHDGEALTPGLWTEAPMDVQRRHIRRVISKIVLTRANRRGRGASPLSDRVAIEWLVDAGKT